MFSSFLFLLLSSSPAFSRNYHSLPPDAYAFPKYKVAFLSNLPVLNETAHKWLKDGLTGGELEFLDQPWGMDNEKSTQQPLKEIGSGEGDSANDIPDAIPNYSLEHMKMGPRDSYLCFIPGPLKSPAAAATPQEPRDDEVTTAHSWSLLQPLSGNCLYHRQGWFTYSYCHNQEIRQFKELSQGNSHIPEEDPTWEAYTLGRAPLTPEPGADLTVAQRNANAANLKLARGAGSSYLVQRWGDGTICDMTGKPREVEVQFHCSMVITDSILFVKESKTCSYVLVIHTPRLCGEPGFRSQQDVDEQAHIRCREIINDPKQQEVYTVSEADHPQKIVQNKPVLPSKVGQDKSKQGGVGDELIRKALQAIKGHQSEGMVVQGIGEDGSFIIEVMDEDELLGGENTDAIQRDMEKIATMLRKAGLDVKGHKPKSKSSKSTEGDSQRKKKDGSNKQKAGHDEL